MKKLSLLAVLLCLALGLGLLQACGGGGGGGGSASVLFVDDDNGMNNHGDDVTDDPDVDQVYTADLDALGIKYDTYRVMGPGSSGPGLATLKKYEVVIWATGESYSGSSADPVTLTLSDQAALAAFLDAGGRLFLSSQDAMYDLNDGSDGDVLSAFANSYLGVLDAYDGSAIFPSVLGLSGDPVSDGMAFSGPDVDDDGYVDTFSSGTTIGSESGSAVWDSAASPQTLALTAGSSSGFANTVFDGTYDIGTLTDGTLAFDNRSFWAHTDGTVSAEATWYQYLGVNQYAYLYIAADISGLSYTFEEYDGIDYDEYTDTINVDNPFPANADTLLVDDNGDPVATRVEQSPWKVIFLAMPYEGLGPEADRRSFLQAALTWLGQ